MERSLDLILLSGTGEIHGRVLPLGAFSKQKDFFRRAVSEVKIFTNLLLKYRKFFYNIFDSFVDYF